MQIPYRGIRVGTEKHITVLSLTVTWTINLSRAGFILRQNPGIRFALQCACSHNDSCVFKYLSEPALLTVSLKVLLDEIPCRSFQLQCSCIRHHCHQKTEPIPVTFVIQTSRAKWLYTRFSSRNGAACFIHRFVTVAFLIPSERASTVPDRTEIASLIIATLLADP